MEVLIFFIIIFIVIIKNANNGSDTKIIKILNEQYDLKNIKYKYNSKNERILTGMKTGEEYIIFRNYLYSALNENIIYDIKSKMNREHFHNGIIVVNNANTIKDNVKKVANENGIEIVSLSARNINNPYKAESNLTNSSDNKSRYTHYEEQDAIQSGDKANSLFGNFFGNKIERL